MASLLAQTYPNFSLYLVDDASTDGSPGIAREYGQKDSRIKLLENRKNCGPAPSRNVALDYLSENGSGGGYVTFVDSDDYVEPDYLAYFVRCHERYGADIVCVDRKGRWDRPGERLFPGPKAMAYFCSMRKISGYVRKSFRWALVRDMRFRPVPLSDDGVYSFEALLRAEKVVVSSYFRYHYTIRDDSVTDRKHFTGKHVDAELVQLQLDREILEGSPRAAAYRKYYRVFAFTLAFRLSHRIRALARQDEFRQALETCGEIMRSDWAAALRYTKNVKTYFEILLFWSRNIRRQK